VSIVRPAFAALGILLGTYLASVGAVAVVTALGERDPRGALGIALLLMGGLLLIAATSSFRREGARGTFLRLPGAIDSILRALVAISTMLLVIVALFVLLISEPGFAPRPELQIAEPIPAPAWASLLRTWLVGGGIVAYGALTLVLVRSLRLAVVVGLSNGLLAAIVGMSHMTTSDPMAPVVVFTGLIVISFSAAHWKRQQTARRTVEQWPHGEASEVLDLPQTVWTADAVTDIVEEELLEEVRHDGTEER
jgi:hypothetical protein